MKHILQYCILGVLLCCMGFQSYAKEQQFTLKSPDGKLVSHIVATAENEITYDIVYNGVTIMLPSHVGLNREYGKSVTGAMPVTKSFTSVIDETVPSPFTRQATMRNHCNQLTLQIGKDLNLVFRAYNEGIAYRYQIVKPCNVRFEKVEYNFAGDYDATVPYVINFDENNHDIQFSSSFENLYVTLPLSKMDTRRLCFLPLLIHASHGVKVCLTESTLINYPGLYLGAHTAPAGDTPAGVRLEGEHARYPKTLEHGGHNNLQMLVKEREDYIAKVDKLSVLPWRIAMVAKNSADLAMNNMSYLLGEPCKVQDLSWIKPGKVAWDWWNNWNLSGVNFKAGINNDTYKYYIDFASRNGIEYVILDEGWAVNGKADLFQVVPEIDLPMLVQYAKARNVGLILWAGYYAFDRDMEHVCQHYSEMGIKGFKIDFMDRDDQIVTQFYERAANMCAKYHLLVDFHGAFKPAGLNRTYPNVLNFEGVAGLEQLKWAPATWNQVQYDTEIPFIRQAAGPMDYTQGAMHNAAKGCYSPCWSEPMSQGTRCHQLALYVVLESPLNMLCDSPTNYEKEPAYTRFVSSLPTVWDETIVLQGEVGEYIVTARRKGDTWYVGGITNWTERDITVDIPRLVAASGKASKYDVVLYSDGKNAHRKGSDYSRREMSRFSGPLLVHLAPGGGFLAKLTPAKEMVMDGVSELYKKRLFAPGDYGSTDYRIPAICTMPDGSLLAVNDKRKFNESDLPQDIDVVCRRSTDNGRFWSEPVTIARGTGKDRGYGDPALVVCANGDVLCLFAGHNGFFQSTEQNPIRIFVCRSKDNGVTWSQPQDITSIVWGRKALNPACKEYNGAFVTSGNGLRLAKGPHAGRVLFVASLSSATTVSDNFVIYSDDNGYTWQVSDRAFVGGNEAKLIEREDGSVLMSVRQHGPRGYNISTDGGHSWGKQGYWPEMSVTSCNGELLRYRAGDKSVLLHSINNSMKREDVSLFVSYDEGRTWQNPILLCPGPSVYSSMTLLPDGSIGMYVELNPSGACELWYYNFRLDL